MLNVSFRASEKVVVSSVLTPRVFVIFAAVDILYMNYNRGTRQIKGFGQTVVLN